MIYHWEGKHGPCVVGETYAQGDRADLAEEIMRLRDLLSRVGMAWDSPFTDPPGTPYRERMYDVVYLIRQTLDSHGSDDANSN